MGPKGFEQVKAALQKEGIVLNPGSIDRLKGKVTVGMYEPKEGEDLKFTPLSGANNVEALNALHRNGMIGDTPTDDPTKPLFRVEGYTQGYAATDSVLLNDLNSRDPKHPRP